MKLTRPVWWCYILNLGTVIEAIVNVFKTSVIYYEREIFQNYFFKPSYAQFVSLKTNNSIFKQILKSYFRLQTLAQQLPIL